MTLQGVYAKLSRARHHAREIAAFLEPFQLNGSYEFTFEDVGGRRTYRVKGVPTIPPELPAVFGDFLANVRSALDHLAYQLALRDNGGHVHDQDIRFIKFPIIDEELRSQPRIREVTDEAVLATLHEVQPIVRQPTNSLSHPLSVLNRLRNMDQHRLIPIVVSVLNTGTMWWGSDEGDPVPHIRVSTQPVMEGAEVAWFNFEPHSPPQNFNPHLELDVRLNHGPPRSTEREASLMALADMIYAETEHFVIGRFAVFLGGRVRHGHTATWPIDD